MHHGEEKPYTCERCGFKFATSSNYKIHIRYTHTKNHLFVFTVGPNRLPYDMSAFLFYRKS